MSEESDVRLVGGVIKCVKDKSRYSWKKLSQINKHK